MSDSSLQDRVQPWMMECFGAEVSADRLERGDRFLEEALELLQSGDYPRDRVAALVEYVWDREKGEPSQEVGGVMITLAAYCLAHGLDMHEAGETELARIWTKVEKIRAKQAAKPKGSALPVALASEREDTADALQSKSDAGVFTARGIGELQQQVSALASEGYRIVTVIDPQTGDYHVVAQKYLLTGH